MTGNTEPIWCSLSNRSSILNVPHLVLINLKPGAEHEELMVFGLARQNVYQALRAVSPDTVNQLNFATALILRSHIN